MGVMQRMKADKGQDARENQGKLQAVPSFVAARQC
jgi:hypothetical protein